MYICIIVLWYLWIVVERKGAGARGLPTSITEKIHNPKYHNIILE